MADDPRSNTTFDLSAAYRALGVRSPNTNVTLNTDLLTPTVQVADVSRSFSPESFESRGVSTIVAANVAAENSICQIRSIAPGGIVVERVDIRAATAALVALPQTNLQVGAPIALNNIVTPDRLNVGGTPVASEVQAGSLAVFPSDLIFINLDPASGLKTFENFGWFIPPNQALRLISTGINEIQWFQIQWREIPQARGQQ